MKPVNSEQKVRPKVKVVVADEQIQVVIARIREALEEGWLAERINY